MKNNSVFEVAFKESFLLIITLLMAISANAQDDYKIADLGEVQLHYSIAGEGDPLILIHGSLADLRYWSEQDTAFAEKFKVIKYSRRYNFPNTNTPQPDHSAAIEARDLLALMDFLDIPEANIVGHSYGAFTALLFALDHPERVKKLILAEPPLLRLLPYTPNGKEIFENYIDNIWNPMGKAFEKSDDDGLEATAQWYFQISFTEIAPEWQVNFRDNVKEWKALALSADAFPFIDPDRLMSLTTPTLLLSADQNQGGFFDLLDTELSRLIPNSKRKIIENSSHEMFLDNPGETNREILGFLRE
ncbi:hypothetical protein BH23BAC2_BH23BAC2_19210 [soil metagenome]